MPQYEKPEVICLPSPLVENGPRRSPVRVASLSVWSSPTSSRDQAKSSSASARSSLRITGTGSVTSHPSHDERSGYRLPDQAAVRKPGYAVTRRRRRRRSDRGDGVGLAALRPVDDLELDRLAVLEGLVPVRDDLAPVDEHVVLTLDGKEAVALVGVEPLHGAAHHRNSLTTEPAHPDPSGTSRSTSLMEPAAAPSAVPTHAVPTKAALTHSDRPARCHRQPMPGAGTSPHRGRPGGRRPRR